MKFKVGDKVMIKSINGETDFGGKYVKLPKPGTIVENPISVGKKFYHILDDDRAARGETTLWMVKENEIEPLEKEDALSGVEEISHG